MASLSPNLQLMMDSAAKVSQFLSRDFLELIQLQSSMKGTADFTERAYKKSERILTQELSEARPGFGIYYGDAPIAASDKKNYRWGIYPLHGIHNFSHATPFFAVVIVLEKLIDSEYQVQSIVVDTPAFRKVYWAELGGGVWSDDYSMNSTGRKRLRVSSRGDEYLVVTDNMRNVPNCHMRIIGAPILELCYVAGGQFDAAIYKDRKLASVGKLIMQESGGYSADKNDKLVFSNENFNRKIDTYI